MARTTAFTRNHIIVAAGLAAAASVSLLLWYLTSNKQKLVEDGGGGDNDDRGDDLTKKTSSSRGISLDGRDASRSAGAVKDASISIQTTSTKVMTAAPKQQDASASSSSSSSSAAAAAAAAAGGTKSISSTVSVETAETDQTPVTKNTSAATAASSPSKTTSSSSSSASATSSSRSARHQMERDIHGQIEDLDKKGKVFFKNKQYLEAAQSFTEALDLIDKSGTVLSMTAESAVGSSSSSGSTPASTSSSSSLIRQAITLMNNRSAMYEKGHMPELALEDCDVILHHDANHTKARTRKLRILESLKRWHSALVEVCAVQLLFMKQNRTNLRLGLPVPPPPVPQVKMEEILGEIIPTEMERHVQKWNTLNTSSTSREASEAAVTRPLPSQYTIMQLLKSYSGFNQWMAQAAKDGAADKLAGDLAAEEEKAGGSPSADSKARMAAILLRRGRRHVYDRMYESATEDFERGCGLICGADAVQVQHAMDDDDCARLLEWTGMVRHWHYNLAAAMDCYKKCSDMEPTNALILVKEAGVQMDGNKNDEAMKLFDTALGIDPSSVDALLHRSNLYMLMKKPEDAKRDLEKLLSIQSNHVMARLRLASIMAALNDIAGATGQLDQAERAAPTSSEVASYRGEILFTQGELEDARVQFERAIELEPMNPTPYVNAAMALLNTPPAPGQMPDAPAVIKLLEKAIEVDPQFTAAYIHLGQLKLGTATDLAAAREVIRLYDQALEKCRSPEEIRELCSMRILAMAQVEAAEMLKMETFSMQ